MTATPIRVLVVDDESPIRRLLRTGLGTQGYQTLDAPNAKTALQLMADKPDLVILDEFQRFRHLLDRQDGGPAAELAHDLFDHSDARVLLLSATPYKPFTYSEERLDGDDHQRDFLATLRFLASENDEAVEPIRQEFSRLRSAAAH